ncbi:MAG TPA: GNAT family N-acetyltransferase [Longimicrobium sp.]|jgi:RimJ/RimL family protein N-acetyltransferase
MPDATTSLGRPAYRIETPRLVVRCYDPADAPLLNEAIAGSLEHLRAWMPWAMGEPVPVEEKAELLRRFRSDFDGDRDYVYGIFSADEARVLGGTGLHRRVGPDALEIGYWIGADQQGRGLAAEAAGALVRVGFEVMRASRSTAIPTTRAARRWRGGWGSRTTARCAAAWPRRRAPRATR